MHHGRPAPQPQGFDRWRTARNRWCSGTDCRAFAARLPRVEAVLAGCHGVLMHVSQEAFNRACEEVVAVVGEHRGDNQHCGIHGALRALGLEPTAAIDVAEGLVADVSVDREGSGLAFIVGMLLGIQLAQGVEV